VGLLVVCGVAFLGAGCSPIGASGEGELAAPEAATDTGDEDSANEREALQGKLAVAERRLEHARMELKIQEAEAAFSVEMAAQEQTIAQAELEQFIEFELPGRTKRSELSLQSAKDRATEAAEELAQIELMYKEQDLEDMTAEFVINRGKRSAERAQRSLELQVRDHEALVGHELPREKQRRKMGVQRADHGLKMEKARAKTSALMKEISLMNAERELVELQRELAKLEEKVQG